MRFIKSILIFILIISAFTSKSQQATMFSQNMFSYGIINPAYFAIPNEMTATGITRQQWIGFKDSEGNSVAPNTFSVQLQIPLNFLNSGIGGSIIQDKIGFFTDIEANIGYAMKFNVKQGFLSVGTQLSFKNRSIDFSKFKPIDPNDPIINQSGGESSSILGDLGFGVFYQKTGKYYIGASLLNVLKSKGIAYNDQSSTRPTNDRMLYIMGAYEVSIPSAPLFHFTPSALIKSNFSNTQISISGLVTYNNKFWGGVTYNIQSSDAFGILLGIKIKNIKIGYAYDLPLSQINITGSHEIMISYGFKFTARTKTESYRNTRFL